MWGERGCFRPCKEALLLAWCFHAQSEAPSFCKPDAGMSITSNRIDLISVLCSAPMHGSLRLRELSTCFRDGCRGLCRD